MRLFIAAIIVCLAVPASLAESPFSRAGYAGPSHDDHTVISQYVTMRDGVRLAVDVWVPAPLAAGETVPAIVIGTRYWRDVAIRWPFNHLHESPEPRDLIRRFLVQHGYAVVSVDARGSGASFGSSLYPRSEEELADYREILDWVVAQPWCNGRLGAAGQAYEGVVAEMMAGIGHPALKAVAPHYAEFDLYTEIAFPGGVRHDRLIADWSDITRSMAENVIPEQIGWLGRTFALGVKPVEGHESALDEAVADHAANGDLQALAMQVAFRDDTVETPQGEGAIDTMSTHGMADAISQHGVPMFITTSWYDAATAAGVLRRLAVYDNPMRVIIGPWNKGGTMNCSPYATSASADVSMDTQLIELVRFFDHYVKGVENGFADQPRVGYYVVGAEQWGTADAWPPSGRETTWYLDSGGALASKVPGEPGTDDYAVDFSIGTGQANRWHTHLLGAEVSYPQPGLATEGRIAYTSPPLERAVTIAGAPVLTVELTPSTNAGVVHAYLEAVTTDGRAYYLTEGLLNWVHGPGAGADGAAPTRTFHRDDAVEAKAGERRTIAFALEPIAARVEPGHRLRLVLAGHDSDSFARIPADGPVKWTIHRGGEARSGISLPVQDLE